MAVRRSWSDERSCLRLARLVTVSSSTPGVGNISWSNQLSCQHSLAIPSWVGAMSTGKKAAMLCCRGVKSSMARVWWQVKLCEPLCNTCHI